MKVLVTGAAGFIGSFLAKELALRGHSVVGIDNINDYYDVRLKHDRLRFCGIAEGETQSRTLPHYRFVQADICDAAAMHEIIKHERPRCVCHLAAQAGVRYSIEQPRTYIETNLGGFFNVMEACHAHGVQHFVYASSSSVYGRNEKTPFAETDMTDRPVSLYAATKKADELMAHAYASVSGLPCTGLRFFTVYGPYGRPDMAPYLFAEAITAGRPIKVFNHGRMRRDFTYISDIVEGVARVIEAPFPKSPDAIPARVFNIGNSSPVSLMDFIATMEQCLGRTAQKEYMPMQPGDVPDTYSDSTAFAQTFGFRPSTSLQEGLQAFCDWFADYNGAGEKL